MGITSYKLWVSPCISYGHHFVLRMLVYKGTLVLLLDTDILLEVVPHVSILKVGYRSF